MKLLESIYNASCVLLVSIQREKAAMPRPSSLNFNVCELMVCPMHRFMRRYRKAGLAILAVFTVQLIAISFCAIPSVHAAPVTMSKAVDMQCTMDMPTPAGQDISSCAHCETPGFGAVSNNISNNSSDVPAAWALITILPPLLYQTNLIFGKEQQPLFTVSEAAPRSTSLIYQTSLRIRL